MPELMSSLAGLGVDAREMTEEEPISILAEFLSLRTSGALVVRTALEQKISPRLAFRKTSDSYSEVLPIQEMIP
jgi:hypothetical protein